MYKLETIPDLKNDMFPSETVYKSMPVPKKKKEKKCEKKMRKSYKWVYCIIILLMLLFLAYHCSV